MRDQQKARNQGGAGGNEHKQNSKTIHQIWEEGSPSTEDHPLLKHYGIQPHGTRVSKEGFLIVPARDSEKRLQALQLLDRDADSGRCFAGFLLNGVPENGFYFAIGKPEKVLSIDTHFVSAAQFHKITGEGVAVAFFDWNHHAVANALHRKLPNMPIMTLWHGFKEVTNE
ncbi:MAG: hypothetical protein FWD67_11195 [Betaproteobacteria bacterium]|nr:hypothetical protein [Betaproteobacteria bacterium]